jgi:hypothetical protein
MPAFVVFLVQLFAGIGIAASADKLLPDKVPHYESTGLGTNIKTLIVVVCMAVGGLIVWFVGKKFKLFKTR